MPRYFLPLLILSLFACCIEVDISVPSFPDMKEYFKVNDSMIQLTIAYNLLGFCIGSILYGPLSDAYGRRPIMIIGNTILAIGALGCVITPSLNFLFSTRLIQGFGAAASAVVVFAMIADTYTAKEKAAKLIGSMNAVFTIAMAAAPFVGGFINELVGWRGNYAIVAVICCLSWLCLSFLLPETKTTFEKFQFRKLQKHYSQLLSSFTFWSASFVPSLLYAAYLAFITQASFLYTETYQLSLLQYVFHQGCIILAFSIMSLLSGHVLNVLGGRASIIAGITMSTMGAFGMILIGLFNPSSPYAVTFFMSLEGMGSAITYPVIFTASLELFPEIKGTASSLVMSMRALICFVIVGTSSYIYNGHPIRISIIVLTTVITCMVLSISLLTGKNRIL